MGDNDNAYSDAISPGTPASTVDAATLDGASLSTDETLANDSDLLIPSEKAVKAFVENITDPLDSIIDDYELNVVIDDDGNVAIPNDLAVTGSAAITSNVGAETMSLSIADGTTPMSITSKTKVVNLNADKVDGCDVEDSDSLGTSDVKLPTQGNVKAYVDLAAAAVGDVLMSVAITQRDNYLLADGSSYSRTTYETLFNATTEDKGVVAITEATSGIVTLVGHGLNTGETIELTTDGTLPTNLSVNTNYYVIYIDADTFYLATSLANAEAGTAIDTSGSISSGDHSLLYCPYGIDGASNFLVANYSGVGPKGVGDAAINGRTKIGPTGRGVFQEDQIQGHIHEETYYESSGTSQFQTTVGNPTGYPGTIFTDVPSTDGTNGTPRTGLNTRDSSLGTYFYIRYQ